MIPSALFFCNRWRNMKLVVIGVCLCVILASIALVSRCYAEKEHFVTEEAGVGKIYLLNSNKDIDIGVTQLAEIS